MTRAGTRSFTTGPGFLGRPSFTGSGRFFAGERSDPHSGYSSSTLVIDQFTGHVEYLSGESPQLSGDGRLVVVVPAGSGRGWYEYTAD